MKDSYTLKQTASRAPVIFLFFFLIIASGGLISKCNSALAQKFPPSPAVKAPDITAMESKEEIPEWLARWELARVLSYMKRYDESVTEYRKLLREKPALAEARVEMAHALYVHGKNDEALRELESVPQKVTSDKARLLMADLYRAQKKYDQAEPLYRTYLKKNQNDLNVRLKLAELLSWSRKYDASLAEYEKILNVRPADIQVRRKYAFVLNWAGRHADAARELQKTLR